MDDSTVLSGETEPSPGPARDASPAVSPRELAAVALIVALADVSIIRGGGYSGVAALIAGIPLLLRLGATESRSTSTWSC